MVNITPITLWYEGSSKTVGKLGVASSYDDLTSFATFSYRLFEELVGPAGTIITPPAYNTIISGTIQMVGQDYIDWDNSNEAAYAYVADKLNLTIVPDPAP